MQNKYVGDIGDFGKYGLLRLLGAGMTLGVVWYLVPDEPHNNDGKHVRYLNLDPPTCVDYGIRPCDETAQYYNAQRLRSCDPELYDSLRDIVSAHSRTVAEIALRHILPKSTVFFEEPLTDNGQRDTWLAHALDKTRDCDLVFMDPDNGLEVPSRPRHSQLGTKYVFHDEVKRFFERGQSLVVYRHLDRRANLASRCRTALASTVGGSREDIYALHNRRGTARIFFVIPAPPHREVLADRIRSFIQGPWQRHFLLV